MSSPLDPSHRRRPRVLELVVLNQRREIPRLSRVVDRFAEECGLCEEDTANLNLILDELVSNVIKYGYDDTLEHQIRVSVTFDSDLVTVRIEDDGKPFNPLEVPPPKLDLPIEQRPIGGLGVHIVKTMADSLDYRRENGCNVVTMKKIIRDSQSGTDS
jgi:anti-sigma regulatory factor (Ser/Thr protein kinase)